MARNVDDLIFASKSVLELVPQMQGSFQGETLMPIPWRDSILPATLKIGYFEEFEGIQVSLSSDQEISILKTYIMTDQSRMRQSNQGDCQETGSGRPRARCFRSPG